MAWLGSQGWQHLPLVIGRVGVRLVRAAEASVRFRSAVALRERCSVLVHPKRLRGGRWDGVDR